MAAPASSFFPVISRPAEYEALVTQLIDLSSFGSVAITTQLKGTLGFGKTTLARAVVQDPRVVETFPDGVRWVTLGEQLTPLDLLSRIEGLLYGLTGEHPGVTELPDAERALRAALHSRRLLLVIDEVHHTEDLNPFLQTGPGGSLLIITHDDDLLPMGTRRVTVDMMYSEAGELLGGGLPLTTVVRPRPARGTEPLVSKKETAPPIAPLPVDSITTWQASLPQKPPQLPGAQLPGAQLPGAQLPGAQRPPGTGSLRLPGTGSLRLPASYIEAAPADVAQAERTPSSSAPSTLRQVTGPLSLPAPANLDITDEELALAMLADRLNDWPLLLAMLNGMLREMFAGPKPLCSRVTIGLQMANETLTDEGMPPNWQVENPVERERALTWTLSACLKPLDLANRDRYAALVVFSPGAEVPVGIVTLLWQLPLAGGEDLRHGLDVAEGYELIEELASRALIELYPETQMIRLHPALYRELTGRVGETRLKRLHAQLVDAFRALCPLGWAAGPQRSAAEELEEVPESEQAYFYRNLPRHLVETGQRVELQNLLFDFDWLAAYLLRVGDLYSLLMDFEQALSTALDQQSGELRLIQDALRMSAPVLAAEPEQLAAQLLGRLLAFDEPEIQLLLQKAMTWNPPGAHRPWLRPLAACFPAPGGSAIRALTGHQGWVNGAVILPDGQHAISVSLDGTLRMWDMASGQTTRSWAVHHGGAMALAMTQTGDRLVSTGWDGIATVWEVESGRALLTFSASNDPVNALTISPDGRFLLTGSDDRKIRAWDMNTGRALFEMSGHEDLIRALALTPDGSLLVSGSWDATVRVWDMTSHRCLRTLSGHTGWVRALTISLDGRQVITGGWDRTLRAWDLASGEPLYTRPLDSPVYSLAISHDGQTIVAGLGDGTLRLFDRATGTQRRLLAGHSGGINIVAITQSGRYALTASDDRSLRVWDLGAIEGARPQPGHSDAVTSLLPLPPVGEDRSLNYAVSASSDGVIKVWDAPAGREVESGPAGDHLPHNGTSVEPVPEQAAALAPAVSLYAHPGGVNALAVSTNGRAAFSGGRDGIVRHWEMPSGRLVRAFEGHAGAITAVAISPDGGLAISGDETGLVKIWDLERGCGLADFHGEGSIWSCAIAQDRRTIMAGGAGGKMYFLEIHN